jgi:hypothetical protein
MSGNHTTGDICRQFGLMPWQILQAIKRGYLPEPQRIGQYRIWTDDELDDVRQALADAGYIPAEGVARDQ